MQTLPSSQSVGGPPAQAPSAQASSSGAGIPVVAGCRVVEVHAAGGRVADVIRAGAAVRAVERRPSDARAVQAGVVRCVQALLSLQGPVMLACSQIRLAVLQESCVQGFPSPQLFWLSGSQSRPSAMSSLSSSGSQAFPGRSLSLSSWSGIDVAGSCPRHRFSEVRIRPRRRLRPRPGRSSHRPGNRRTRCRGGLCPRRTGRVWDGRTVVEVAANPVHIGIVDRIVRAGIARIPERVNVPVGLAAFGDRRAVVAPIPLAVPVCVPLRRDSGELRNCRRRPRQCRHPHRPEEGWPRPGSCRGRRAWVQRSRDPRSSHPRPRRPGHRPGTCRKHRQARRRPR